MVRHSYPSVYSTVVAPSNLNTSVKCSPTANLPENGSGDLVSAPALTCTVSLHVRHMQQRDTDNTPPTAMSALSSSREPPAVKVVVASVPMVVSLARPMPAKPDGRKVARPSEELRGP